MSKHSITILQLYPRDMNIYGDNGNVLVLKRRLEWRGIDAKVIEYNPGDTFPDKIDIVIGGGGQDSGQNKIHDDLLAIGPKLRKLADGDTPMLVVCGLYQLFGHFFKTHDNEMLEGIGLLDIETYGRDERLIGNIVLEGSEFGEIIGYENHSGQTFLKNHLPPLAKVQIGAGNNVEDDSEGARYKNVIGTYLHGSILPKNPKIADFLIRKAMINKYGEFNEPALPDHYADKARAIAATRPR